MKSVTESPTKLHKCESLLYFSLWTGAVLYSVYQVGLINSYFNDYDDLYGDFAPGWSWIGKKQDVSDQEWRIWIPLMIKLVPWIFIHHLFSQIVKTLSNFMTADFDAPPADLPERREEDVQMKGKLLCCWYIFVAVIFLYFCIGALGTLCALAQSSILYTLAYKRSKSIVWTIHVSFLLAIHFLKIPDGVFQNVFGFSDQQHYILTLTMCWIQLRSISCTIDNVKLHSEDNIYDDSFPFASNFFYSLAYCLYLPTLSLGPLVLYHEFLNSVNGRSEFLKPSNLRSFTFNLTRYVFWIFFANFTLHFLYFSALQYHPEVVKGLNSWALYGLGYCMGQFFLIKYVVVYGLSHTFCAIDNIKAPSQPKCVARVHLYSDMWKYFDQGLYKFLVRYIYIPLLKTNCNKLVASFLCFAFVFIWHGMQTNIFIWAFMNFIGLNVESLMKSLERSKHYLSVQNKYLSRANARRFNCILTSPLLAVSVISNFYFFAGEEIGNIYTSRLLHGTCNINWWNSQIEWTPRQMNAGQRPNVKYEIDSWYATFVLHFFLYCCCQVSTDVKIWEVQKRSKI